jgi:hypothetical protein
MRYTPFVCEWIIGGLSIKQSSGIIGKWMIMNGFMFVFDTLLYHNTILNSYFFRYLGIKAVDHPEWSFIPLMIDIGKY